MTGGGFTLVGGGAMAGHGLGLHHANKFNTISNIHKRGERGEWHLSVRLLSDLETFDIIIICTNTNDICLKSNSFQELISAAVYCQTQTPGCRDMTRVTITRRAVCCWPGGGRGPGSPCLGW